MERKATSVVTKCKELRNFWSVRDSKMRQWYRLVQQVDELKTEKMESFVGNDPRALYNLSLHILGAKVPHRLRDIDVDNPVETSASESVGRLMEACWKDAAKQYRKAGPHQDLHRTIRGFLLSTGWYAIFAPFYDSGQRAYVDVWNPIDVYPMWSIDFGLSEVAHIYKLAANACKHMAQKNSWSGSWKTDQIIYDYWWIEESELAFSPQVVWNAVVIGNELVKFEPTRFSKIPIYVAPVGGLPDTGSLSEGTDISTQSYNAGGRAGGERWKEEIGQSIVATNEHVYRTWNKWWTFSLQLLRDTAQPRIFERSRSGKPIVKPEEVFRRGVVWRGGSDDMVEFVTPPAMPIELRSNQLDLEAMMQRGGVSWSMYGSTQGQMSAYVMSQISASANQVISPFHQALEQLYSDIDTDWLQDILDRKLKPYNWKRPDGLTEDSEVDAAFAVEIPGDLVQRLTAARMADPNFRLSYTYVMEKLFPDVRDAAREKARVLADQAQLHPTNGLISLIQFYRMQAEFLNTQGDYDTAELYALAAEAAMAQLKPQQEMGGQPMPPGTRTEAAPPSLVGGV